MSSVRQTLALAVLALCFLCANSEYTYTGKQCIAKLDLPADYDRLKLPGNTRCPICSWTGLGWLGFWVFHCVPDSASADWEFGRSGWLAGQDGGTPKSKSTQPRSSSKWDTLYKSWAPRDESGDGCSWGQGGGRVEEELHTWCCLLHTLERWETHWTNGKDKLQPSVSGPCYSRILDTRWHILSVKYCKVQCIPLIVSAVGPPKNWHYKQ